MPEDSGKRNRRSWSGRKTYQVFVSHATADKWIARTICEKLELAGATTFRDDRDIQGGDDIPEEIRTQIRKSDELLVILTPESIDRTWVLIEVGASWGARSSRRIVAVLCHVTADRIPTMLQSKKAISINDLESYLSEIANRIARRKS